MITVVFFAALLMPRDYCIYFFFAAARLMPCYADTLIFSPRFAYAIPYVAYAILRLRRFHYTLDCFATLLPYTPTARFALRCLPPLTIITRDGDATLDGLLLYFRCLRRLMPVSLCFTAATPPRH